MQLVHDLEPHRWIVESSRYGQTTGFNPQGWPDVIWVLHAAYETAALPDGLTHDDVLRIERSADVHKPSRSKKLDELLQQATATGGGLGPSSSPGAGWKRITWHDLASRRRTGTLDLDRQPDFTSFGSGSWPVNIQPPSEGALDFQQHHTLLSLIAQRSPEGLGTACFAFYSSLAAGMDFDHVYLYATTLGDAISEYGHGPGDSAPNNVWAADRSWVTRSDWDLWATKVSAHADLIAEIERCPDLETIRLRV